MPSLFTRVACASATVASLALFTRAQTLGCTTGGVGGVFPTSGTGGGSTYPTFPPFDFASTLAVTSVPVGSTCVTEVKLFVMSHTYTSDCQFVLEDPSGSMFNLWFQPGGGCDFSGDYVVTGVTGAPFPACATLPVAPGAYAQVFGAWVSGTNGVNNTVLDAIAPAVGNWTLHIYDWAGADIGNFATWDICFGTPPPPPPPTVAPNLTSPFGGQCVASVPLALSWSSVPFATSYDLDLDGNVTTVGAATTTNVSPAAGPHTWSVRGTNPTGNGPWAAPSTFSISAGAASVCVTGGAAGAFPVGGANGTWPLTLPTGEMIAPLAVTIPAGASKIVAVRLNGFNHSWAGDAQLVLESPAGVKYNLFQQVDGVFGGGCSDDFAGDYSFVDVNVGQNPCGGAAPIFMCVATGGNVNDTTLAQYFGAWTDGDAGIFNTPLESIPIAGGTWNLIGYDWYVGADNGSITSWDLCFDALSGPTAYCTPSAPGTTNGCIPTISGTGNPNVAHANSCVITVANVEGQQSGIMFYGVSGTVNVPWCQVSSNSFLCVKAPLWRTSVQSSGGTFGSCSGAMSIDWNAYQIANPTAFGNPWAAGDQAHVQGWFRDPPACKTTFLSEALELTYIP